MEQKISELPYIENTGRVNAVGKITVSGSEYTVGYHEDENAARMEHLPMLEGRLPQKIGEIALPQFILEQLTYESGVGDEIELNIASGEETLDRSFMICGIISSNTGREAWEFAGWDQGYTIKYNDDMYCPVPCIYISSEELPEHKLYTDLLIRVEDAALCSGKFDEVDKTLAEIWETDPFCVNCSQAFVLAEFCDAQMTSEDGVVASATSDTSFMKILSYMIMLAAVISMFTGVISIMPSRIESLRLLRSIGMSKRSLVFLFITEFFLFWVIGTAMGVGIACGLHELVLFVQRTAGIAAYHGYIAEYVVRRRTMSPFLMPIILSFIIAVVSMIVPIYKILTMSFYKRSRRRSSKRPVRSFSGAYAKMSGARLMAVITCISTIIVIVTTSFGYCYYTNSGKGTSFMTRGMTDPDRDFYKVNGIDLREAGYSCMAHASLLRGEDLAVPDREYGVTQEAVDKISEKADTAAWGNYRAFCVMYKEGETVPETMNSHIVPFSTEWEFYGRFKDKTLTDVHLVFLNEKMMDEIGGFTADDVVCISGNLNMPYEVGDTVPLFSCLSTNSGKVRLDTIKYMETQITGTVSALDFDIESNYLLDHIGIPSASPQCFLAMTAEKAQEIGFYHPAYENVLMTPYEMTEAEMKAYVKSVTDTGAMAVTMSELEHNAGMQKLSATANYGVLFLILFILSLVGTWNLLKMNISNNQEKFAVMHSVGMSVSRLRRTFIGSVIKYSATAAALGSALSLAGQQLIRAKFDRYMALAEKCLERYNMSLESFTKPTVNQLSFTAPDDPIYPVLREMLDIENKFFLTKELWLPDLLPILAAASCIILLFIFLLALSVSRKIEDERSNNDDRC